MRLKVLSIGSKVSPARVGLSNLPIEILEYLLTFCDLGSLFKTRLTSSKLCLFSSKGLAERLQLDWKVCLAKGMSPIELLLHHPLKYFENLSVHVSRDKFALSWLDGHHLNPSIIPSLLRIYPDRNKLLLSNMILNLNRVYGVLDSGDVVSWTQIRGKYKPTIVPCKNKISLIYENKDSSHIYAIRFRDRLILTTSTDSMNDQFLRQLEGRDIQCLYNGYYSILAKLEDDKLLSLTVGSPCSKIPERLSDQRIKSLAFLKTKTCVAILENGDLVGWGKDIKKWDFSIPKDDENIPRKALSILKNYSVDSCSILLEDRQTILQCEFLPEDNGVLSKRFFQLRDRVERIYAAGYTHLALLSNGSIAVWGKMYGGEDPVIPKDTAIRSIHQTSGAFAILLEDGRVLVFGNPKWGGRQPDSLKNRTVIDLFSTHSSFLALLDDHTIISWSNDPLRSSIPSRLVGCRVQTIFSNACSFLALLEDGSLYCWGDLIDPEGKRVIIPEGRIVKYVTPTKGTFIIHLDNDELILLKVTAIGNLPGFRLIQYPLSLPEGRRLAVMDKGI